LRDLPKEKSISPEGELSFYSSMFMFSLKESYLHVWRFLYSWVLPGFGNTLSLTHLQENALVHEPPLQHYVENIKQAKGNECSQYKSTAAIFSSSLPICPHPYFLK
jgi:hypothetical protein